MRKTIKVSEVLAWVNTRLACPDSTTRLEGLTPEQAFRLGAASLFEQIAFATGNYAGFNYQDSEIVPNWRDIAATADTILRPGYDDTRRFYYQARQR